MLFIILKVPRDLGSKYQDQPFFPYEHACDLPWHPEALLCFPPLPRVCWVPVKRKSSQTIWAHLIQLPVYKMHLGTHKRTRCLNPVTTPLYLAFRDRLPNLWWTYHPWICPCTFSRHLGQMPSQHPMAIHRLITQWEKKYQYFLWLFWPFCESILVVAPWFWFWT